MRGSVLFVGWMALAGTLLGSCAADQPKDRSEETETYTPQPMSRSAEAAGDGAKGAGTQAAAGDAKRGEQVYKQYCVTCHMANGQGMAGVYPPLAGSEFLADKQKTVDAVANGLQGKITVKGKEYNSIMPPIPGSYSNADIAAVVNYVSTTFGGGAWTVTEEEVAAVRKK